MSKSDIVKEFEYRGRMCVIRKIDLFGIDPYHCGYVEAHPPEICLVNKFETTRDTTYDKYYSNITCELPTFSGKLENMPDDMYFVGFDMGHLWNDEKPWTKTQRYVESRIPGFADELIEIEEALDES